MGGAGAKAPARRIAFHLHPAELAMLQSLQRPIALILLPASMLVSSGCTSVHRVPATEVPAPTEERLAGITTLAGRDFEFDSAGVISRDTVYAQAYKQPLVIPVDSVQRWWLRRTDAGKTLFAVVGV